MSDDYNRTAPNIVPPKDPEYDLSVWLNPDCHLPPPRWLEWEVFEEITRQSMHFLRRALRNTDDPGQALRVMARAEKLIGQYCRCGILFAGTDIGVVAGAPLHRGADDTETHY
jgi:hypothetical protein